MILDILGVFHALIDVLITVLVIVIIVHGPND